MPKDPSMNMSWRLSEPLGVSKKRRYNECDTSIMHVLAKKARDFIHGFVEMVGEKGVAIVFDNPQVAVGQVAM